MSGTQFKTLARVTKTEARVVAKEAVLAEKAANAGYDLAPVTTLMEILRAKA